MAIAGSMTTAYKIELIFSELIVTRTTYPSDKCAKPDVAADRVRGGGDAIVAGSDMTKFNELWDISNE